MALPDPEPGLVIPYDYLWRRENDAGAESGRKTRPAVIVLKTQARKGWTIVWVAPVTHSAPNTPDDGIEIPSSVKAALKLDRSRSWIVCTEINEFLWPGFDVQTIPGRRGQYTYGFLPPGLFRAVRDRILANAARLKRVARD
jgi:mRNA-degrading endonuclease toxin of MazEF toxin-antitoxin module